MIEKNPLDPQRIRKISGSFAFIEHRFLRDGFFGSLEHHELLLYLFLVLVSDRSGLSYYSYEKICTLLHLSPEQYITARNGLIKKDLIMFDGFLFQLLSLPVKPVPATSRPLYSREKEEEWVRCDAADIARLVDRAFPRKSHP